MGHLRLVEKATGGLAGLVCCAAVTTAAVVPGPPPPIALDIDMLAANALIMTGTAMHDVDEAWIEMALGNYIQPTLGGGFTGVPIQTPAQFWPFTGPEDMLFDLSVQGGIQAISTAVATQQAETADTSQTVIFGYSQSAVIATLTKRSLAEGTTTDGDAPPVSFVMLANPNRPNGGINSRFTGAYIEELGWTFSAAAPTDTPFSTVDVARQYDIFADFPRYPLNLFATANALLATLYGAHDYTGVTLDPADPGYNPDTVVEQRGDTTYYFIPSETLPLLKPLRDLGVDPVLLDAAEPTLRLLVEYGYDRTTPFGQPAPAMLTQREDFDQLGTELTAAVEQGRAILEAAAPDPAPAPVALPGTTTKSPLRPTAPTKVSAKDVPAEASRPAKPPRARAVPQAADRPAPSAASRSRR